MRGVRPSLLTILFTIALPARAEVGPDDVLPIEDTDGSIASSFLTGSLYLMKASRRFLAQRPDQYDALVFFQTTGACGLLATPEGWPVRQDQRGIGRKTLDETARYGSRGRLRHAMKMGNIACFPEDPDAVYSAIPGYTLTAVELLGHEFGHHWLASARFDLGDGTGVHCRLRARNDAGSPWADACDDSLEGPVLQHWSAFFHQGSVMYAPVIEDLGGGRFRLSNPGLKYGDLDQYLMGLRGPDEVGPQFLVDNDWWGPDSDDVPPRRGETREVRGRRLDFTIEDVIRALGPREPSRDPCHWKVGLAIVHPKGHPPSAAQRAKVARYAQRWQEWYAWATDGRGSLDPTLDGRETGTAGCPGDPSPRPDDPRPSDPSSPEAGRDVVEPREDAVFPETTPWPEGGNSGDGDSQDPGETDAVGADPGGTGGLDGGDAGPIETPGGEGGCPSGSRRCHGDRVQVCPVDGTGWVTLADCSSSGRRCVEDGVCASVSGGGCGTGVRSTGATVTILLFLGLLGAFLRRGRPFGNSSDGRRTIAPPSTESSLVGVSVPRRLPDPAAAPDTDGRGMGLRGRPQGNAWVPGASRVRVPPDRRTHRGTHPAGPHRSPERLRGAASGGG